MRPGNFDPALFAELHDLAFTVAGIGTSQPAARRDLPGHGDDPHVETGAAALFFEHQSHTGDIEGRETFHFRNSFIDYEFMQGFYSCVLII